jgi:hypothetical protein
VYESGGGEKSEGACVEEKRKVSVCELTMREK